MTVTGPTMHSMSSHIHSIPGFCNSQSNLGPLSERGVYRPFFYKASNGHCNGDNICMVHVSQVPLYRENSLVTAARYNGHCDGDICILHVSHVHLYKANSSVTAPRYNGSHNICMVHVSHVHFYRANLSVIAHRYNGSGMFTASTYWLDRCVGWTRFIELFHTNGILKSIFLHQSNCAYQNVYRYFLCGFVYDKSLLLQMHMKIRKLVQISDNHFINQ